MSVDRDHPDPGVVPPQPVFRPLPDPSAPVPGLARLRLTPRFLRPASAAADQALAARPPTRKPQFARFAAALEATGALLPDLVAAPPQAAPAVRPCARQGPDGSCRAARPRELALAGLAGAAAVALAAVLGLTLGDQRAPIAGPAAQARGLPASMGTADRPEDGAEILTVGALLAAFRPPQPKLTGGATNFAAVAPPAVALPLAAAAPVAPPVATLPLPAAAPLRAAGGDELLRFGSPGPGLASGSKLASAAGMTHRGFARPAGDAGDPLYELGYRLQRKGETASAIAAYQLAAEINPQHAATFYNWGYLLQQQGDEAAARVQYRQALQLAPQHAFAHYNLGYLLQKAGDDLAAIEHYRAAIAANPRFAWSHYNLAWLEQKLGRYHAALADYRRSIELDPQQPLASENIATILRHHR